MTWKILDTGLMPKILEVVLLNRCFRSYCRKDTIIWWSLALISIILVAAATAACGGEETNQPQVPEVSPAVSQVLSIESFEGCTGLLDVAEVRESAGRGDIELGEPNVNSGRLGPNDSGIIATCIYDYVTPETFIGGPTNLRESGPAMTLTVIAFDSRESAVRQYRFALESLRGMRNLVNPGSDITEGVLGDDSYLVTLDAERVGTAMGFVAGPYGVALHTTLPNGQDPLVGPQDLIALAGTVREHLVAPE